MIQFHLQKIQQIFLKKKKVDNFFLVRMGQSPRNLIKIHLMMKRALRQKKGSSSDSQDEKATDSISGQKPNRPKPNQTNNQNISHGNSPKKQNWHDKNKPKKQAKRKI